jgi:hypothetical protein
LNPLESSSKVALVDFVAEAVGPAGQQAEVNEWKAYEASLGELTEQIEELKHGRFQVA